MTPLRKGLAALLCAGMLNAGCASTGSLGGDVLVYAGLGGLLIAGAGAAVVSAASNGVDDAAEVNDAPQDCLEPQLDAFKTAEVYEQVADCYERMEDAENAERMRQKALQLRRQRGTSDPLQP